MSPINLSFLLVDVFHFVLCFINNVYIFNIIHSFFLTLVLFFNINTGDIITVISFIVDVDMCPVLFRPKFFILNLKFALKIILYCYII